MADDIWRWVTSSVGAVIVAFVSVLSWHGRRQIQRIDTLEQTKANKTSVDARFDVLLTEMATQRRDLADHAKEARANSKEMLTKLSETNAHLAKIEGRLERQ